MKNTCKRCGHEWNSRVILPKSCPACRSYKWRTAMIVLLLGLITTACTRKPDAPSPQANPSMLLFKTR